MGNAPAPENTHVVMCGSPQVSEAMISMLAEEGLKTIPRANPDRFMWKNTGSENIGE
jgi:hypothetical protein